MPQSFLTVFSSYAFAPGFNNAGALAVLNPQPTSPGLLYAKWSPGIGGKIATDGLYTEWRYLGLPVTVFETLRTTFGFNEATGILSVEATVSTRVSATTYTTFNCVVSYPKNEEKMKRQPNRWSDIVFTLSKLRAI